MIHSKLKDFSILLILGLISCSTASFYGDIDLGSNFFYAVAEYNSINLSVGPGLAMDHSITVIENIDSVGFNDTYIFAISDSDNKRKFWIIDKKIPTIKNNEKNGSDRLDNVFGPLDSTKFTNLRLTQRILLFSSTYYRHKAGYK